ncbi:hypothetical protein [Phosphitispora fastidiosa]|uniref:hypothetical protein n=1 Tax=Phosphitispora fastidiosa TaxID=2837202 RepID=UPI001E55C798|nr:hypothetical protein [Phosphitispora fastidiosa]MBU7005288.1 hypothetical protein [Phosphitispora fastidiosa]
MTRLGFYVVLFYLWLLILTATHVALSIIVYKDARTLKRSALGLTPVMWGAAAFSLPVIGMFIYWVMNYSTLKQGSN